jgi:hypothetical protein
MLGGKSRDAPDYKQNSLLMSDSFFQGNKVRLCFPYARQVNPDLLLAANTNQQKTWF